jgi:hypothetical protein
MKIFTTALSVVFGQLPARNVELLTEDLKTG